MDAGAGLAVLEVKLFKILLVLCRVCFETSHCTCLAEVNCIALVFNGWAFGVYPSVGVNRAEELPHRLDRLRGHRLEL